MKRLFLFFFIAFLVSCSGGRAPDQPQIDYSETDTATAIVIEELRHVKKNLDEVIRFFDILYSKGYKYDESFVLPLDAPTETKRKEALALGAYGTDMSYASLFGQEQMAIQYAKRISELAENMGLTGAFSNEVLMQLAESDSSTNKMNLLTNAYLDATNQLHDEDRSQYVALIIVGGWLEGLHLSASMLAVRPGDRETTLNIYDQIYNYHTSKRVLEAFPDNADCQALLEGLNADEPIFRELLHTRGNMGTRDIKDLNELMIRLRDGFLSSKLESAE